MKISLEDAIKLSDKLSNDGDYRGAIEVMSSFIAIDDSHAVAFALRGHSYFSLKLFKESKSDFDKALILNQKSPNTLFMRARCCEELNDLEGAERDYKKVIDLDSNALEAYFNLGLIYEYMGHIDAARTIYAAAPQDSDGYERIRERLSILD